MSENPRVDRDVPRAVAQTPGMSLRYATRRKGAWVLTMPDGPLQGLRVDWYSDVSVRFTTGLFDERGSLYGGQRFWSWYPKTELSCHPSEVEALMPWVLANWEMVVSLPPVPFSTHHGDTKIGEPRGRYTWTVKGWDTQEVFSEEQRARRERVRIIQERISQRADERIKGGHA